MKSVRDVLIVMILAVSLLLPAADGSAQGVSAASPGQEGAVALVAVFLDEPARLAQAQQAGLVLYSREASAGREYLLAGMRLVDGRAPEAGFPMRVLDMDISGAAYYVVYPMRIAAAVQWADYGQVLLDLGDQVVLRAAPAQAEQLPALGAEIVRITLDPKPWPAAISAPEAPLAITPSSDVQAMLAQVSTDTIARYTRQLSGEESVVVDAATTTLITRRYQSVTPSLNAAHYLGEHLQSLGMTPEYHVWNASYAPNVIGEIAGRTNPGNIYIIGGHFDDSYSNSSGAPQAPGADDNASGTVGALIAADILSQYKWNCTLRFGFWNGEEGGLLGSAAYASRSKTRGETILGYLNMDMISYNAVAPSKINLFADSTVNGSVAMSNLFVDAVAAYSLGLQPVQYLVSAQPVGNQSDNKSFWNQGYASILAIEDYVGGDETPYYHSYNDRLMYSDMAYYTDFVKAALATFVHLAGCLTPDFRLSLTPAAQNVCTPANAAYTVNTSSIAGFSSSIALSATGLPAGATATFTPSTVSPGSSSTLTISGGAAGAYDITVTGTSGSLTQSKNVALNLSTGQPAAFALTAPADGVTGVAAKPAFTWDAAAGAASYTLQVATDPAFSSLVINQSGLTSPSYTPNTALAFDSVYYWRVIAVTGCGSASSTVRAFRTAATGCITYTSTDVPKAIVNNNTTTPTDSTITVPDTFTVTDANVTIGRINHTYDADLDIYLRHPDDTTQIRLSDDNGSTGDNYVNTVLDDAASNTIGTTGYNTAPFTGNYKPEAALSGLNNKTSFGTWRLRLFDDASNYATGSLETWSLTLCGSVTAVTGDYSDLAASYGIAWHTGSGALRLGAAWTADSSFAAGNDNASDDGITLSTDVNWGDGSAKVDVAVNGGNGCLSAWMDKGKDGAFDVGDLIVDKALLVAGANAVPVSLGGFTFPGTPSAYNFRFRLTPRDADNGCDGDAYPAGVLPEGSLAPLAAPRQTGPANGGEVEDREIAFGPLAVTLAGLNAAQAGDAIVVTWETVSELHNLGFNLWRGTSEAEPDVKLNEYLIPSQSPGSSEGTVYTWEDRAGLVPGATYWYWLEDLDTAGSLTRHDPVSITYGAPTAVTLRTLNAGASAGPALGALAVLALAALAGVAARRRMKAEG